MPLINYAVWEIPEDEEHNLKRSYWINEIVLELASPSPRKVNSLFSFSTITKSRHPSLEIQSEGRVHYQIRLPLAQ